MISQTLTSLCTLVNNQEVAPRFIDAIPPLALLLFLSLALPAISLLACKVHLSEHAPVSCKLFVLGVNSVRVSSWIANHDLFKQGLVSHLLDFGIDCSLGCNDLMCQFCNDPCSIAKRVLECICTISRDTQKAVKDASPVCSLHKFLLVSSFFTALVEGNVERCEAIAKSYAPWSSIDLDNWSCSKLLNDLQAHYEEIQQTLALERSREEQSCNEEEDRESDIIDFGSLSSSYKCGYRTKPGGYSSISALCISCPEQDAISSVPLPRPTSQPTDGWGYHPPPLVYVGDASTPPPHSGPSSGLL